MAKTTVEKGASDTSSLTAAAADAARWRALGDAARAEALGAIVAALGGDFALAGDAVVHVPTQTALVLVPGGWLRMGLPLDEVFLACQARKKAPRAGESSWFEEIARARPPRWVRVAPFLIGREPTASMDALRPRFRLPSEAELEWLLRDAGQTSWVGVPASVTLKPANRAKARPTAPFGLEGLVDEPLLCEDAWHASYAGGPSDGAPWGDGREVVRQVHTTWQDDEEEVLGLHAAARHAHSTLGSARAALSLDGLVPSLTGPPPARDDGALVRRARESTVDAERKASAAALELALASPGDDLAAAIADTLDAPPSAPKDLALALAWVGRAVWGPWAEAMDAVDTIPATRAALVGVVAAREAALEPLLDHADAAIRAHVAVPLARAAAAKPSLLAGLRARFERETDKRALASLAIGVALAARATRSNSDLPTSKALAKLEPLLRALDGDLDAGALFALLEGGEVSGMPWFGGDLGVPARHFLLHGCPESERARVAHSLLARAEAMSPRERDTTLPLVLELLFEDRTTLPGAGPEATFERERLLAPGELTAAQRAVVEALEPIRARLPWRCFGLPEARTARDILLGRSASPFARVVDTPRGPLPLFFALADLRAETVARKWPDQGERAHARFGLDLAQIRELDRQQHTIADLYGGYEDERDRGTPLWPYASTRALCLRIQRAPAAERAALRAVLEREIEANVREKRSVGEPLFLLAVTVTPPDTLPASVLDLLGHDDWRSFRYQPSAIQAFGPGVVEARVRAWVKPSIERFVGGQKEREGDRVSSDFAYAIDASWSPETVLALVAYELTRSSKTIAVLPVLGFTPPLLAHFRPSFPPSLLALYSNDGSPRWEKLGDVAKLRGAVAELAALAGL